MTKDDNRLNRRIEENNFQSKYFNINLNVTIISIIAMLIFIGSLILFPTYTLDTINKLYDVVINNFANVIIFMANIFVVLLVAIIFMPWSKKKIGGEDAQVEFSFKSWVAMLFAAGMGIGLVFWGLVEPVSHFLENNPMYATTNDVNQALATSYFNWGIHAWAIYGAVAIILAYYYHNLHLPLAPRSFFYPVLKDKIFTIYGDIIDAISILVTVFGLTTSLGLGVGQINGGLNYVFNLPYNHQIQVILIIVISLIATLSVVSGLDKGVKILSNINLRLAFVFMLFIFLLGPSMAILSHLFTSTADYFVRLVPQMAKLNLSSDMAWKELWPVFYIAWWISYSPSVGIFIAKISRGRTIREMIIAILLVPTVITIFWIAIFGGLGIETIFNHPEHAQDIISDPSLSFFKVLDLQTISLWMKKILSLIFIALMIIFFITSSDSGSIIIDSLASGGAKNTSKVQRILWAQLQAIIAALILMVGGVNALNTMQILVISSGLLFGVVIIMAIIIFIWSMRK